MQRKSFEGCGNAKERLGLVTMGIGEAKRLAAEEKQSLCSEGKAENGKDQ